MSPTPYGVQPNLKRLLSKLKPRSGWRKMYAPAGNIDMHEEEN